MKRSRCELLRVRRVQNVTDFLPPAPYNQDSVQRWCQGMYQTFNLNDPRPDSAFCLFPGLQSTAAVDLELATQDSG